MRPTNGVILTLAKRAGRISFVVLSDAAYRVIDRVGDSSLTLRVAQNDTKGRFFAVAFPKTEYAIPKTEFTIRPLDIWGRQLYTLR